MVLIAKSLDYDLQELLRDLLAAADSCAICLLWRLNQRPSRGCLSVYWSVVQCVKHIFYYTSDLTLLQLRDSFRFTGLLPIPLLWYRL